MHAGPNLASTCGPDGVVGEMAEEEVVVEEAAVAKGVREAVGSDAEMAAATAAARKAEAAERVAEEASDPCYRLQTWQTRR